VNVEASANAIKVRVQQRNACTEPGLMRRQTAGAPVRQPTSVVVRRRLQPKQCASGSSGSVLLFSLAAGALVGGQFLEVLSQQDDTTCFGENLTESERRKTEAETRQGIGRDLKQDQVLAVTELEKSGWELKFDPPADVPEPIRWFSIRSPAFRRLEGRRNTRREPGIRHPQ
jgi:hypothetical protein